MPYAIHPETCLFLVLICCVSIILMICLKSLDAQADLSVLAVEINNLCLDLLTNLQNVRRLINMISGDLRYMKQCVYARLQLNECAEIGHTSNTTLYYVADCILLSCVYPRILLREL